MIEHMLLTACKPDYGLGSCDYFRDLALECEFATILGELLLDGQDKLPTVYDAVCGQADSFADVAVVL